MNVENKTDNKDEGSDKAKGSTLDNIENPDSNQKKTDSSVKVAEKVEAKSEEKPRAKSEEKSKKLEPKSEMVKLNGLYATKLGMSVIYDSDGSAIPVTALRFDDWVVSQVKSNEKDGYSAVQIVSGKKSNVTKPEAGHLKKSKLTNAVKFAKEIRSDSLDGVKPGDRISIDSLKKGDIVKITSKSKGRGFSGTIKRHGFSGGPASHGSRFHRRPGSIGMCEEPGRVLPGRSMPGRFGFKAITIRNVKVAEVLPDDNVLLVKGGVPGARNTLVKLEKQAGALGKDLNG